jgi:glycosyltransferase involved in cell wall biosynthesis
MKIAFSATNPCHMYPLAREVAALGGLDCYYSGYPRRKLPGAAALPIRTHTWRTLLVYGSLRWVPVRFRPSNRTLFLWQDHGFDRWVARTMQPCDFLHAMPGQALETFRRARELGIHAVLNHATGPVREWVRIMEPEYRRVGLKLEEVCPFDAAYFAREDEEYGLSDYHCVASSVVRNQLVALGIDSERIWLTPYGADTALFHRRDRIDPPNFRIVFAGLAGLRKGVRTLLCALELVGKENWQVDLFGGDLPEVGHDLASYSGRTPLKLHGAISQEELAAVFRRSSVLVLPSLEEGFGLVVPQALNCGLPCIVSDRVGAKDLITHRQNGSVVPVENPEALAQELLWWSKNWHSVNEVWEWREPAKKLMEYSTNAR